MKRKEQFFSKTVALLLAVLMTAAVSGCGQPIMKEEPPEPAASAEPAAATEPAAPSETEAEPGRQNGERFEAVIMIEGMEETVNYEHIRNDSLGFEMDYDYEQFVRHSESDREYFVSEWDDPDHPENYLEVTRSPESAETVAAAISEELSREYDVDRDDSFVLERAGSCIRIEASVEKGSNRMAQRLQTVYVIPAGDGCRIVTAHYFIEGAEGFGRRFRCFMETFAVIPGAPA